MTMQDFWVLSPQLAMLGVAVAVVFADMFVDDKRPLPYVAIVGLAAPLFCSLALWFGWFGLSPDMSGLRETLVADRFALFFHFLVIGVTAAIILSSIRYVERLITFKGEFLALILFASAGMLTLVAARELISIYVALELTSLPAAALAAFGRDGRSSEAGLKFLILSAISSAVLLYGMVFIYGLTGSTRLEVIMQQLVAMPAQAGQPFGSYAVLFAIVMMVAGFGFKLAVVPFQMWVPDVYEGAPTPVAAYLSIASKAAAFAVVLRVLYTALGSPELAQQWSLLFAALAVASMTAGNLLALWQRNIKRLLGYSTIAHAGYILVGIAAVAARAETGSPIAGPQGVLYYLGGYAFTNLAVFFAVIAVTNRTGNDLVSGFAGMGRRSPMLAILLTIGVISLLGIPPTVGFMSKAFLFSAAVNSGLAWLAVVGMINTVISAFYYLNIVRTMYLDEPAAGAGGRFSTEAPLMMATTVAAIGTGLFGIVPWLILNLAEDAVRMLPLVPGA